MTINPLRIFGPEPVTFEKVKITQTRHALRVRRRGEAAFSESLDTVQRDAYDALCDGYLYSRSGVPIPRMRFNDAPGNGQYSSDNERVASLVRHYERWRKFLVTYAPKDVFTACMAKLDGDSPETIARTLNPASERPNQRRAIRLICLGLDAYAYTRGWSRTPPKF